MNMYQNARLTPRGRERVVRFPASTGERADNPAIEGYRKILCFSWLSRASHVSRAPFLYR